MSGLASLDPALLGQPVQMDQIDSPINTPNVLDNPTAEDQARAEKQALAWNVYNGKLADPLKRQKDGLNDNAKSNRLKPIVQKGASFLFPPDLTFSVGATSKRTIAPNRGLVDTGQQNAQDFLDMFWKANQQQTFLHKLATNGGVFGHAFLKVLPAQDRTMPPRLLILNPLNVRVETDPDDCDTVTAYVIGYKTYDPNNINTTTQRRQVVERVMPQGPYLKFAFGAMLDGRQTWQITDQVRQGAAMNGAWVTVQQEQWPWPFPPIFDCQNLPIPNDFWGEEDITPDLIEQNMAINFNQSNIARILKWHASPLTWATGVGNGQIDRAPDNIVVLQGEGAALHNLEMSSDLASSLNFLANLRANMDEQSRVPAVALGRQDALPKGNLSGVALQLLFQPLIEKTNQKRPLYGEMLEQVCSAVLVIAGFAAAVEAIPVSTNWPQVLPQDPIAEWQVAPIKMQSGVSRTTLLEEGGYDPDEEAILREQEAKEDANLMKETSAIAGSGSDDDQSQTPEQTEQQDTFGNPNSDDQPPAPPPAAPEAAGDANTGTSAAKAKKKAAPPLKSNQSGLIQAASHISAGQLTGLNHPKAVEKRNALRGASGQ
jgi:hypothetical protein